MLKTWPRSVRAPRSLPSALPTQMRPPQLAAIWSPYGASGGAGVGGGSLVYANTLYRPHDAFYRDPQWEDDDDFEEVEG